MKIYTMSVEIRIVGDTPEEACEELEYGLEMAPSDAGIVSWKILETRQED